MFPFIITIVLSSLLTIGIFNPFGFFKYNSLFKFNQIVKFVRYFYYEKIDEDSLFEGALNGYVSSLLDPYTEYMDDKSTKNFEKAIDGNFSGIGVCITKDDDGVKIISSFENSPARKNGINGGEAILYIDDVEVKSISDASNLMLGPVGTKLKLTIVKDENEPKTIEIERENINIKTVYSKIFDDIGYVKITQFSKDSYSDLKDAVSYFESKNIKKLIIDLRDNPGGTLESSADVLSLFIPKDNVLFYTVDKRGKRHNYKSKDCQKFEFETKILVNEKSASASEVFTGAFRDYKKGLIFGNKTFGKGVVQQILKIMNGSSLKITVSRYYTPNGECIDKKGIEPDVYIEGDEEEILRRTIESFN